MRFGSFFLCLCLMQINCIAFAQGGYLRALQGKSVTSAITKGKLSTQSRLNALLKEVSESSDLPVKINLDESRVAELCRMALLLEIKGYHSLAEDAWLSAIRTFSADPLPYAGLLNYYQRNGSSQKFFNQVSECSTKFPKEEVFLLARLQRLNQLNKWTEAYSLAKQFLNEPHVDEAAIVFEVMALLGNNEKEKALELSELLQKKSYECGNHFKESQSMFALCQLSLDRPQEAKRICQKVLELDCDSQIAALVLLQSYIKENKIDEALSFMKVHFARARYSRALAGAYSSLLANAGQLNELAFVLFSIYYHDYVDLETNSKILNANFFVHGNRSSLQSEQFKQAMNSNVLADRKKLNTVLMRVDPSELAARIDSTSMFKDSKSKGIVELLLADCYRQIGRSDVSRQHLLKAVQILPSYSASRNVALYLDDEAADLSAMQAYKVLSVRFPQSSEDLFVKRRMQSLRRMERDPSQSLKYATKRFAFQCYIKEILSIQSVRSNALTSDVSELAKQIAESETLATAL